MSITDELREWVTDHYSGWPSKQSEGYAITDRIDKAYDEAMSRAGQLLADAESDRNCYYVNWQDCKQKVLQGNITFDELNARIESLEDELSHSIELPKDADSEYIHMGDVMESRTGSDLFPQFEVRAMRYDGDGWEVIDRLGDRYEPSGLRHYHAPTVEDVLDEFANRLYEKAAYFDEEHVQKAITEYAAKLRLAGDAE